MPHRQHRPAFVQISGLIVHQRSTGVDDPANNIVISTVLQLAHRINPPIGVQPYFPKLFYIRILQAFNGIVQGVEQQNHRLPCAKVRAGDYAPPVRQFQALVKIVIRRGVLPYEICKSA